MHHIFVRYSISSVISYSLLRFDEIFWYILKSKIQFSVTFVTCRKFKHCFIKSFSLSKLKEKEIHGKVGGYQSSEKYFNHSKCTLLRCFAQRNNLNFVYFLVYIYRNRLQPIECYHSPRGCKQLRYIASLS